MEKTVALSQNRHFKRLYYRGKSKANKYVVLYVLPNHKDHNRLGITVSKKLGKAVVRNRARRLIKESYRLMEHNLKTGYDIVVVSRHATVEAGIRPVQAALYQLLLEQGIVERLE